jgi:hypothetical protein
MATDPFNQQIPPEVSKGLKTLLRFEITPGPGQCRCHKPIRNPHLKPTAGRHTCGRCLKPMIGSQLEKAKLAHEAPRAHGSSTHRQARVEKFNAEQRRKAEKRNRAKRNRR